MVPVSCVRNVIFKSSLAITNILTFSFNIKIVLKWYNKVYIYRKVIVTKLSHRFVIIKWLKY